MNQFGNSSKRFETADEVSFFVDGKGQTQITLELESNKEYRVFVETEILEYLRQTLAERLHWM